MKPLDMADRYTSMDDEPTLKVQVPVFSPKVIISSEADIFEDDEPTIPSMPSPLRSHSTEPIPQERRYPGVGLMAVVLAAATFWGTVGYLVFHH